MEILRTFWERFSLFLLQLRNSWQKYWDNHHAKVTKKKFAKNQHNLRMVIVELVCFNDKQIIKPLSDYSLDSALGRKMQLSNFEIERLFQKFDERNTEARDWLKADQPFTSKEMDSIADAIRSWKKDDQLICDLSLLLGEDKVDKILCAWKKFAQKIENFGTSVKSLSVLSSRT